MNEHGVVPERPGGPAPGVSPALGANSAWSVGIDVGHGETAAARMSLRGLLVGAEASSLEIDNRKSIITAVARTPGGEVLLGKTALIRDDALDVRAAFKAEPSQLGAADRRALQTFFRAVCETLDTQNGGLLRRGDAAVHVGVPSGWSAGAAAAYRDLLRNDIVPDVILVPESRAALLHALEVGLIRRSEVERTVLVIDVGSLTTDFTIVADLQARPSERGHQLGAGLIDRSVLRWVLDHSPDREAILAAFEIDPSHLARCEIACREAKVRFFDPSFERSPNPRPIFVLEVIDTDLDFQARLTKEAVREIVDAPLPELAGRSWPRAFRQAVEDVRAAGERQGIEIELVLLTGGPSRMGFVQEICREVFGAASVRIDSEPELAIARGLARYGSLGPRVAAFREEVGAFVGAELPDLVRPTVPDLRRRLAGTLAEAMTWQGIKPALLSVKQGQISSLEALDERIRRNIEEWAARDEAGETVATAALPWIQAVADAVNARTAGLSARYGMRDDRLTVTVTPPIGGGIGWAVPPFDLTPVLLAIGGGAVAVVAAIVAMSAKVTAPLLLVTLVFPALGGWLEDRLRSAPVMGIGRFVVPSEARIDELLRDGLSRLEAEVDEYLRDPGAFLAARERVGLLDRLGSLRERLPGLFRDGDGGAAVQAAGAPDFDALVVSETVQQIETALQARAREAERFIL
jgi:hypothetical protein